MQNGQENDPGKPLASPDEPKEEPLGKASDASSAAPHPENLQREYGWVLEIYKADLDIHYRRQQMMLALESAGGQARELLAVAGLGARSDENSSH
ncbi:MAG TPA: hypothetical protein VGZ48_14395 [Candidatus Acidoferrales bacterium]|nr:hypothetical protein [Candidatus Acidoferrales bacterium]